MPERSPRLLNEAMFRAYEEGRDRRYRLLFAVHGGALALVGLVIQNLGAVIDADQIPALVAGFAAIFAAISVLMGFDLYGFGVKMRRLEGNGHLFSFAGQLVVLAITGLLALAWAGIGVAALQVVIENASGGCWMLGTWC